MSPWIRRCRPTHSWRHYGITKSSIQRMSSTTVALHAPATLDGNITLTTPHDKYPRLFSPLTLPTGQTLPNRVLMGSMHTGLEGHSMPGWMERLLLWLDNSSSHSSHRDHSTLDPMAAYFRERAQGGVGLMVTGGIAPNRQGWAGPFSSQLTNEKEMMMHRVVTDAVHSVPVPVVGRDGATEPARICLQILHTGRYAYHPWAVSASATKSPISVFKAKELDKRGIQQTQKDFVRAALLAKQAGYDGVEIMGSEGYLLSQFLSPRTNLRNDEYGGTLQGRAKLSLDIIRATRQATGDDFIIIFRLSLLDLVENGLVFEESQQLARWIQDAGATILNTGIGWHEARVPTISTAVPRGAFSFPTKALKESGVVDIPIVATNRINHPQTAEDILTDTSDMISMARPFLADPELLLKAREGREDEINTCIGCNQACLDHVFVGRVASCLVNPRAGHETELNIVPLPENERLNIGVVGAGPAGCSFAIVAAQMGHKVTLYDKDGAIGGQFNMAKRVPGKEEFYETLRYFETMLRKHNVKVSLNTVIAKEDMERVGTDKWVIASGVNPRDPRIPGQDHPNVFSYIDVLKHKKPVGNRVAIIGAGGIGFDVGEYLLHWTEDKTANEVSQEEFWKEWGIDSTLKNRGGLTKAEIHPPRRQLYLLQRKAGKLGAGLGKTTGWIHRASLNQSGAVKMLDGVRYDKIDDEGNLHITRRGAQQKLEVDSIVICAGQVEQRDLQTQADGTSLQNRVYTIGGAYKAGELDAKRAIDMGARLALAIHKNEVVPGKHVHRAPKGVEERLFAMIQRYQ